MEIESNRPDYLPNISIERKVASKQFLLAEIFLIRLIIFRKIISASYFKCSDKFVIRRVDLINSIFFFKLFPI